MCGCHRGGRFMFDGGDDVLAKLCIELSVYHFVEDHHNVSCYFELVSTECN